MKGSRILRKPTARAIAIYQLLSAAAFAVSAVLSYWSGDEGQVIAIFGLIALINLVAGIAIFYRRRWGYWLSLVNLVLQIPSITWSYVTYEYNGLGSIGVSGYFDPATTTYLFGPILQFSPTFMIWFGATVDGFAIAFDLLAVVFAIVLVRQLRQATSATAQAFSRQE